ncbi:hypothetical protein I4U23_016336 [Adineta vaga]|nr:hypothetical protein I4U23_016336 [Adineta vaga]
MPSMTEQQQQKRVILVTGANKGIGFEVVKKLIQGSTSNNNNTILLGSRDIKRGQDALQQLGSPSNVHLLQLDTSSKESIVAATNEIKQKYGGHLDVIINNAGIAARDNTIEGARKTFETNYYGVKILNEHLIPLLREHGRVANVASGVGPISLYFVSKDLQEKYSSPTLTTEQLDHLVEDFLSAYESNHLEQIGYSPDLPLPAYGVSKAALIALTRVEALKYCHDKKISIYAVCPGFCATDLNDHATGARSAALGADSILYVIDTQENQLENGAFYQDEKQLPQICTDEAKANAYVESCKKFFQSKE